MADRPLVLVSNRGPSHGGGGLVAVVGSALDDTDATWVSADDIGMSDDDYRAYYDVISNGTLWFLHHGLWDAPRRPRFDRHWWAAWDTYRDVNDAYAAHVAEHAPPNAIVLVQDYHLCLVAPALRARRDDVSLVHFHHTPFASREERRVLPGAVHEQLMRGLESFDACGFHTQRWADNFGGNVKTFVSPAAANAASIRSVDAPPLDASERKLIVRVDRIELSKNIVRGFHAFDDLLRTHPEWRGNVEFGAFVYPSREGLAEYQAYRQEVEGVIARINAEWATDDWTPIRYDATDDFPRSVAALHRYDVLLVNPVRDGLNLVAKEGLLVNERDGVLVLSQESGAFAELADACVPVHPFDIRDTSEALHRALSMPAGDRAALLQRGRAIVESRTASDWLADQVSSV